MNVCMCQSEVEIRSSVMNDRDSVGLGHKIVWQNIFATARGKNQGRQLER